MEEFEIYIPPAIIYICSGYELDQKKHQKNATMQNIAANNIRKKEI